MASKTAEQKAEAAAKQRARRAAKKAEALASTGTKPESIPEGFKWCPRFKQVLPVADFARNKASKDGLYAICKAAEAADRKAAAERRKASPVAEVPASRRPKDGAAGPKALSDLLSFNPVPEGSSAVVISRGRRA